MQRNLGIVLAAAAVGLFSLGSQALHATGSGAPLVAGVYAQDRWDEAPRELDEVSRRGFHDGVEGARKDYGNHRRPDVNNRDEFRNPHVPGRDREAYRSGFERGYQVAVDHLYHGRL